MTEDERARQISKWLAAVDDALRAAKSIAHRGSEAHEGSQGAILFHEAGNAIARFMETDPAMKGLRHAAIPPSMMGGKK